MKQIIIKNKLKIKNKNRKFDCLGHSHSYSMTDILPREPWIVIPVANHAQTTSLLLWTKVKTIFD